MKHALSLLCLLAIIVPSIAYAQSPKIISVNLPTIGKNGDGVYVEILKKAWNTSKINIQVLPGKRAITVINTSTEPLCVIPLDKSYLTELGIYRKNLVFSAPLNWTYFTFYGRKGFDPLNDLSRLQFYSIGGLLGNVMPNVVSENAKDISLNDRLDRLELMLRGGRIDHIFVPVPDFPLAVKAEKLKDYPKSELAFFPSGERLACDKTLSPWIEKLNIALKKMSEDGDLENILGNAKMEKPVCIDSEEPSKFCTIKK